MSIQRYAVFEGVDFTRLDKDDDGGIVVYSDHQKETDLLKGTLVVASIESDRKDKAINKLMDQLSVLRAENERFREALGGDSENQS